MLLHQRAGAKAKKTAADISFRCSPATNRPALGACAVATLAKRPLGSRPWHGKAAYLAFLNTKDTHGYLFEFFFGSY